MAKKASGPTFREIMTAIKKQQFANTYILMGEEEYYLDQIVEALEYSVVDDADKDFNLTAFYGADADVADVMSTAQQYPVMAPRQLVMLKEAQSLDRAKTQLDKLASYVARPNPTTVFVIVYKDKPLGATSQLIKKAKEADAVIFSSDPLKDYQLAGPIRDYCTAKGFGIDDKAVQLLSDYIGNPLSKLFGEIDKLIIAVGDDVKRITPDTIEKNIGISKDFNTFELLKCLGRKDYPRAMMIVEYFAKNPKTNPAPAVVAILFGFFSKLFIATVTKDKSDASLMEALELRNQWSLRDYRDALRYYNAKQALAAVHSIRECDTKSKGIESTQDPYELLKELVFKIVTAQ